MSLAANDLRALAMDARLRLETLGLAEPAVKICIAALARMEQVLARPPRIAIMGEINSGKTSVADLLLGGGVLPASVVSNTHIPVLIRYADNVSLDAITQQGRHRLSEDTFDELPSGLQLKRVEIGMPDERLLSFEILDTPGDYVPGVGMPDAQIFLWCTVATRAWTESERVHWVSLPRRCRSNGLLVATHKDALVSADDVAKVEHRLRTATSDLFRDVVFVSATAGARSPSPYIDTSPPDESAADLLARVSAWAAEIGARRARKAERIIRHLARLTFHRLAPGPLTFEAQSILNAWQVDCAKLVSHVTGSQADVSRIIHALLVRFAHSMTEARAGRAVAHAPMALPEKGPPDPAPYRRAAARRYVRLIGADLTTLLRINLAEWGLRDPSVYGAYAAARSALLPLADLDATFDDLGRRFTKQASDVPDAAELSAALAATSRP